MNGLYLYVSVHFLGNSQKKYWYIADDYSIKAGDYVAVLVDGKSQICQVINTCMYSKETAPYNVDETKHIISKVDKATSLQMLVLQDIVIDEKHKDCGHYNSRSFSARDLPIKTDQNIFEFKDDSIASLIIPEGKYYIDVDYEEPFLLPDGYKTAYLFNVIPADPRDEEGQDIVNGLSVKTLIIPKGYSNVVLEDCKIENLFISNGVNKITIPYNFRWDCKTLFISKDLTDITIKQSSGLIDSLEAFDFEKIVVDPNNSVFKLKDGALYQLEDGHKYIVWVSKYIQHLIVGQDIDGIGCLRPELELEISDNSFFDKQELYLTKKRRIDTFIYKNPLAVFLNKFKSVYVEASYQKQLIDKEHIKNLIIGNGVTIFRNFKCRQSFLDNNEWIVNGCSSPEDFQKFVDFDLKPHDDFLGFVKRDSYQSQRIDSIVDLLDAVSDKQNIDQDHEDYLYFENNLKEFGFGKNAIDIHMSWKDSSGKTQWFPIIKNSTLGVELLNGIRNKLIKVFSYKNEINLCYGYMPDTFIEFVKHRYENYEDGMIKLVSDYKWLGGNKYAIIIEDHEELELGKIYDCILIDMDGGHHSREVWNYRTYKISCKKIMWEQGIKGLISHIVE